MESNNDIKIVATIAAIAEYISKYISKPESRDDSSLMLKDKL